jgi:Zn-dependent peptidase ImmA (M78 family)
MYSLAREARGISQLELSVHTGMQRSYISFIESGFSENSEKTIQLYAQATGFPASFFFQAGGAHEPVAGFRKRKKVPGKLLKPVEAKASVIFNQISTLTNLLAAEPTNLQSFTVKHTTPATAAKALRKLWNLEDSPVIPNLTRVLEKAGILIHSFNFNTERIDSLSLTDGHLQPVISLNNNLKGDRLRYSLAYELGHLILHSQKLLDPERDLQREANEFASEFLMPEKDIRKELTEPVTVMQLGALKKRWKVSMIALLYRADDLGIITANQKRYLVQQFNDLGYRRREPAELDIAVEKPALLRKMIADCMAKTKSSIADMAALFSLHPSEYREWYE